MTRNHAATALLLAAIYAGVGAATQQSATAEDTTHTLHLKLHVTAGRDLDKSHFAATERVRSRDTHEFVGFDTFRGRVKTDTVVFDTAFAFKSGLLLTRVHAVKAAPGTYAGRVTGGTGAYEGATGTVKGRAADKETTRLTIRYTK